MKSHEKRRALATTIWDHYLKDYGEMQISVDGFDCTKRNNLSAALPEALPNLFDEAEKAIVNLMSVETHYRFIRSDICQRFIREHESVQNRPPKSN